MKLINRLNNLQWQQFLGFNPESAEKLISFPADEERKILTDCITRGSRFMLSVFHNENIIGDALG